jgi:prolyl-tRNA editing enzyme YbaK/EbsC (Cys-tRNA(Pro) deacylase)
MSYITAKKHLEENNLDDRIIEFNTSTATVALAAKALGVSDGEIAKSMSFIVNDNPILVIVAGDKKIDNHKYKEEFKVKAKMISFDDVETLIGHKAGGVCPFGINDNVRVYYFQNEFDIITDLDNYRDNCHHRPEYNRYMFECIRDGKNEMTLQNYQALFQEMYDFAKDYPYTNLWAE